MSGMWYITNPPLSKAFDTISHDELWKIMLKFGCPEHPTQMVRQLHDWMMAGETDTVAIFEATTSRLSEEQPIGTEDGASRSGNGELQGGHDCTQRNPLLRTRLVGGGRRRLHLLLERPPQRRATGRGRRLYHPKRHRGTTALSAAWHKRSPDEPPSELSVRGGKFTNIISLYVLDDQLDVDYVLVRRRNQMDVLLTKMIPGADGWTDHRLVLSKMRIHLLPRRRPQVQVSALAVLGGARWQHEDWFDDEDVTSSNLTAEKNCLYKTYVNRPTGDNTAAFYRSRRLFQQRLREMQDAWRAREVKEIQRYADRNEWKNVFVAIKVVYNPTAKEPAPLLRANGATLLSEKTQILKRWAEHFRGVINRSSTITDAAIVRLPQVETNVDLDLPPPSTKPSGPIRNSPMGKHRDRTRYLLRFTSTADPKLWDIRRRSSRRCGIKEKSLWISRTPQSSIPTSGKGTANSATAT
nr:unnamed protein product [Spirometra erinaceieuropaei]